VVVVEEEEEEEDKDGGGEAKEKAAEVACSSRRPIRGGGEVRRLIGSTFSTPKVSMGSLFNECVLVVKVVKREEAAVVEGCAAAVRGAGVEVVDETCCKNAWAAGVEEILFLDGREEEEAEAVEDLFREDNRSNKGKSSSSSESKWVTLLLLLLLFWGVVFLAKKEVIMVAC